MKQVFSVENDGFCGAYYGGPEDSRKAVIIMLGDSTITRLSASEKLYHSSEARARKKLV